MLSGPDDIFMILYTIGSAACPVDDSVLPFSMSLISHSSSFDHWLPVLELLECRSTKWTCNAQGLPNLKLSLSAGAWQELMVQRGSNRVPADVCKCCHQCMHTPHASSLSLSWINPKARKSLHAPVRLLHAPKKICAFWNDLIRGLIWRHIAFRLNWASDSKLYEAYEGASI